MTAEKKYIPCNGATDKTAPPEGYYKLEDGKLYLWDIELLAYFPVALSDEEIVILEEDI